MNRSTVTVGGRAMANVGCAVAWATALLAREDSERELVVFENDRAVYVIETKGDGSAVVRKEER